MSQHNIETELEQAAFSSSLSMFKTPEGLTLGMGTTVGNGIEGWAPGAIFIDTDADSGDQLWINTGTTTTASWQNVTTGSVNQLELGSTGLDAVQPQLTINAITAAKGSIVIKANDAAAAYAITIVNAANWGQASTLTIPDPGAATSSFILSAGVTGIVWSGGTVALALDYQGTPSTATTGTIMRVGTGTGGKIPFATAGQRGFAIYMDNTATSGTFTGMRLRSGVNPSSGANSVDNLLAQVSVETGKNATTVNVAFFEIIPKGSNTITTGRVLLCNADSAASQIMTTQIIGHFRVHTRGDETITNDEMLRLENEAVGGNGRQLDSFIRVMGASLSGGIKGAAYLIDGGTDTSLLATGFLRLPDDGTVAHDTDTGDGTAIARSDIAGYITVTIGSATRYIPLMDAKTSAL